MAGTAAKCAMDLPYANICVIYSDFKHQISLAKLLEWCICKQASFCQAVPGRLAVFLHTHHTHISQALLF